jgi:hypothetical protein
VRHCKTGGSWAAVLGTAALLSAACGGGDDGAAGGLPECAGVDQTIERPAALPADFPTPDGTVFMEERESGGFVLIEARTPGELTELRASFEQELEAGGYEIVHSEAESHEAEIDFAGDTDGHLVLHKLTDCDGVLRLGVTVR